MDELLREIDASIRAVDKALDAASNTVPLGHRVGMVRSQLETAREVLVKARGFAAAKASGTFSLDLPPKKG